MQCVCVGQLLLFLSLQRRKLWGTVSCKIWGLDPMAVQCRGSRFHVLSSCPSDIAYKMLLIFESFLNNTSIMPLPLTITNKCSWLCFSAATFFSSSGLTCLLAHCTLGLSHYTSSILSPVQFPMAIAALPLLAAAFSTSAKLLWRQLRIFQTLHYGHHGSHVDALPWDCAV